MLTTRGSVFQRFSDTGSPAASNSTEARAGSAKVGQRADASAPVAARSLEVQRPSKLGWPRGDEGPLLPAGTGPLFVSLLGSAHSR